jgi:arylsulfatase A-like enzyme
MIQTGQGYLHARRAAPTFAQAVKAAGYASIRSGKFGNNPNQLDVDFDQHLDGKTAEGNANNLIAFIKEHAGRKPLFLYLAPHEPHDPQFAPDRYYPLYQAADIPLPVNFLPFHPFDNGEMTVRDEKTLPWPRTRESVTGKLARYYASTTYLDDQAGRVLDALRQAGQFDNTIIIIAGDNGLSLGEHGLLGKQNLYEFGGMHVPLVFAGPGIPHGETRAFAYLMDIYPTVCELTGSAVPSGLDAKSLAPVITGKAPSVRAAAFTAYRDVQRAIRDDRWKLIRYPHINQTQLFDLQADPHEMTDLAGKPESADKIKELLALLEGVRKEYGDTCALTSAHPQPAAWSPNTAASELPKKRRAKKRQAGE